MLLSNGGLAVNVLGSHWFPTRCMSMIPLILASLAAAFGPVSHDSVKVVADLPTDVLEVGGEYEFVISADFGESLSASEAGIPAPILQIAVPKSVKLLGKELKTYAELKQNEFLEEPYERLLKNLPATIRFKLVRKPKRDDHFSLNFLAYTTGASSDAGFLRRRLILPVAPNATSSVADSSPSDWGKTKTLQIGDKAKNFKLTDADGHKIVLKDYKGEKNVIVTTYRAFW